MVPRNRGIDHEDGFEVKGEPCPRIPLTGSSSAPVTLNKSLVIARRKQKILNMFAREMETIARKAVDEELASLLHNESRGSFGMGGNAAGYGIPVE